jgi:hypothetical protein
LVVVDLIAVIATATAISNSTTNSQQQAATTAIPGIRHYVLWSYCEEIAWHLAWVLAATTTCWCFVSASSF